MLIRQKREEDVSDHITFRLKHLYGLYICSQCRINVALVLEVMQRLEVEHIPIFSGGCGGV